MKDLSSYEKFSMGLAAAFLLVCGIYFLTQRLDEQPYRVTVTKTEAASSAEAVEDGEDWPDSLLPGEKININRASAADLGRLPGIGEKRAEDIVAWREAHGGFENVEQLMEISGIGEGILGSIRDYITVESTD